jgi:hypothetical protein
VSEFGERCVPQETNNRRLLRARRERPRRRRTAEQRDDLAPFHYPMPPVLPTETIAHLGLLRCGISITRVAPGQSPLSCSFHFIKLPCGSISLAADLSYSSVAIEN